MPRAFARVVVLLAPIILPIWIAAGLYAAFVLPQPQQGAGDVISLVPRHAAAIKTEIRAARLFRIPFSAETAVVQRNPNGLPAAVQARVLRRALRVDRAAAAGRGRMFAIPLVNTAGIVPGSREANTTAITYLAFPEDTAFYDRDRAAHAYAQSIARDGDSLVGVTGFVPATLHEGRLVEQALPLIEAATIALVALLVGLKYRALGAPIMTLVTVGVAYACALQVLRVVGKHAGFTLPSELEPLMVALVLGIGTDYSIFFLSNVRAKLARGLGRVSAAREATAQIAPIIAAGGCILAAGLASLAVTQVSFFHALGPGLAVTVVAVLVVALALVPSSLALFGRWLFWPNMPRPATPGGREEARARRLRVRQHIAYVATRRPIAFTIAAVCAVGLGIAANQVRSLDLGFTSISGLPASAQERRAADAAKQGFADGVVAPTSIVLQAPGITAQRGPLIRFEGLVNSQPGVAATYGPREQPLRRRLGFVLAGNGNAARIIVILDKGPLGASGIADLRRLESRLPGLARRAGLGDVRIGLAGDTAIAKDTVDTMRRDLVRVAVAAVLVNLVLLMLFLRSLIAPLYLVAASVLAVTAALGITSWVFQDQLGHGQLTYYVPFAAAVLLVSLGSDYNVYVTGRVWQEARVRSLREAVAYSAPRTASAVRTAGITLAGSFALIAIVPTSAFREFAFAMAAGILLETFIVRSLMVPSLIALVGPLSGWPGRWLRRGEGRRG